MVLLLAQARRADAPRHRFLHRVIVGDALGDAIGLEADHLDAVLAPIRLLILESAYYNNVE